MRKSSKDNPKKVFDLSSYPDVKEHLEEQTNMTKYIVNLVRKDMANVSNLDKESIFDIIEEYLQMKGITATNIKNDEIEDDKLKAAALKIMGKS